MENENILFKPNLEIKIDFNPVVEIGKEKYKIYEVHSYESYKKEGELHPTMFLRFGTLTCKETCKNLEIAAIEYPITFKTYAHRDKPITEEKKKDFELESYRDLAKFFEKRINTLGFRGLSSLEVDGSHQSFISANYYTKLILDRATNLKDRDERQKKCEPFFKKYRGFFPCFLFDFPLMYEEGIVTTKNYSNKSDKIGKLNFERMQGIARNKQFLQVLDDFTIKVPEVADQLKELKGDLERIAKMEE